RLRRRRGSSPTPDQNGSGGCNVGLVLLGMDDTLVHVPVLSQVLHGVESAVTAARGSLLFANLPNADPTPAVIKRNQVEGLIVKTSQYNRLPDPETNRLLKKMFHLPVVWLWAKPDLAPGDLCSFNHQTAAELVAGHLADRGHRRIAYMNPKK